MSISRRKYLHFSFPQEAVEARQLLCLTEELPGGLGSILPAPRPPTRALPRHPGPAATVTHELR